MRVLLDTNAVDPLVDQLGALEAVEAAVARGTLTVLLSLTSVEELSETRDEERRLRLLTISTRVPVVAEGAFIVGRARVDQARLGDPDLFDKLQAGNPKHTEDALIVMAAFYEDATLVTNEIRLPKKAIQAGVDCMTTAELLDYVGFSR
jgi:predicted nucleic acid-binding protein